MSRGTVRALSFQQDRKVAALGAPVEVRRHPSARRMTLKVSHTRRAIILTVPNGVRLEEAGNFLARHLDWVRDKLGEVPDARPFADGGELPVRGVLHRVCFAGERSAAGGVNASARRARGDVVWSQPAGDGGMPLLCIAGQREHAPRRLQDWLTAQARRDLGERVAHHAKVLGLRPRRISVRDQTSRWGSCSSTGQLCFSWRLVLAPAHVLDYVAAHEVAHLKEMNHSTRFWALVARTFPDMSESKVWLNAHGRELHCYGRAAS
jgi:predicted metal-dependent hydrolase